jgi:hypothetical protein
VSDPLSRFTLADVAYSHISDITIIKRYRRARPSRGSSKAQRLSSMMEAGCARCITNEESILLGYPCSPSMNTRYICHQSCSYSIKERLSALSVTRCCDDFCMPPFAYIKHAYL